MSDYRDDLHDIAVASDETWLGWLALSESIARASDHVLFGVGTMVDETAHASDEIIDRVRTLVLEDAQASADILDHLHARTVIAESGRAVDRVLGRLRVLHEDTAVASDETFGRARALVEESAQASDEVFGQRHVVTLVMEHAKASDLVLHPHHVLVEESATATDAALGRARARDIVIDSAAIADAILDGYLSTALVVEHARVADEVFGQLHARQQILELALITDTVIQPGAGAVGAAWTANTETWAMSRYQWAAFDELAVIDGRLYGMNEEGLFALDGDSELIEAAMATAPLDLGEGLLVHPLGVYMEYELSGEASLTVEQTQSGVRQTYSYTLPAELSQSLTNGRFVLGKGLRGRHFGLRMDLVGHAGYVNDLNIEVAPTTRRT